MANYVGCSRCGKAVSREVEGDLVVRAYVECPECVERQAEPQTEKDWAEYARTLLAENKRFRTELAALRAGGQVDLKAVLAELENKLVTEKGWELEDGTANRIMDCLLLGRTTSPLCFFIRWLNGHAEARGALAELGLDWSSGDDSLDS